MTTTSDEEQDEKTFRRASLIQLMMEEEFAKARKEAWQARKAEREARAENARAKKPKKVDVIP